MFSDNDEHLKTAASVVTSILGRSPKADNSFKVFLYQYINAIVNAMLRLDHAITYESIVNHGINIETLIKDYMTMLASNHDQGFELKVKAIRKDLDKCDFKSLFVEREMFKRDLYVVALWHYCKDQNLFDSVASTLARTYEYNFRYYQALVDAFLNLHLSNKGVANV